MSLSVSSVMRSTRRQRVVEIGVGGGVEGLPVVKGEEGEGEAVGGVNVGWVGGVAFGEFEPEAAVGRGQAAEHGADAAAGGLDGFGATMRGSACVFGQQVDGVHVGAHAAVVEQAVGPPAGQGGVDHALDARLVARPEARAG